MSTRKRSVPLHSVQYRYVAACAQLRRLACYAHTFMLGRFSDLLTYERVANIRMASQISHGKGVLLGRNQCTAEDDGRTVGHEHTTDEAVWRTICNAGGPTLCADIRRHIHGMYKEILQEDILVDGAVAPLLLHPDTPEIGPQSNIGSAIYYNDGPEKRGAYAFNHTSSSNLNTDPSLRHHHHRTHHHEHDGDGDILLDERPSTSTLWLRMLRAAMPDLPNIIAECVWCLEACANTCHNSSYPIVQDENVNETDGTNSVNIGMRQLLPFNIVARKLLGFTLRTYASFPSIALETVSATASIDELHAELVTLCCAMIRVEPGRACPTTVTGARMRYEALIRTMGLIAPDMASLVRQQWRMDRHVRPQHASTCSAADVRKLIREQSASHNQDTTRRSAYTLKNTLEQALQAVRWHNVILPTVASTLTLTSEHAVIENFLGIITDTALEAMSQYGGFAPSRGWRDVTLGVQDADGIALVLWQTLVRMSHDKPRMLDRNIGAPCPR